MSLLTEEIDRAAAMAFLWSRIDYERTSAVPYDNRDFRLDRMRELLALVGNPQQEFTIVHVAGTKGKGSTAAMLGAMLTAAGYRTGIYTSPHLDRLEERLAIGAAACSPAELVDLVKRIEGPVAELDARAARQQDGASGPTYFEIITAMALLHFADRRVHLAILEVGLGGRLDSTNVCRSDVAVITSISFDHTRQLGNTLAAIAGEKAGIIKHGVPVVSGVAEPADARAVIQTVARQLDCPLAQLGVDFDFDYRPPKHLETASAAGSVDFFCRAAGREQELRGLELKLLGRHQAANAAVALAAASELSRQGWDLPQRALRRGLAEVQWPARMEVLVRRPTVVLDSAHNGASVAAFVRTLDESFDAREQLLIFGTTTDKDVRGMLRILAPRFAQIVFTRYLKNPRSVPPEELQALAAELAPGKGRYVCPDAASAWRQASALASEEHLIAITGSIFLAAELRNEILAQPLAAHRRTL